MAGEQRLHAPATGDILPVRPEIPGFVPGMVTIGLDDPVTRPADAPFPDRAYHAYKSDGQPFVFDAFFNGERQGVGNDLLGTGLYCADASLTQKYQNRLGAKAGVIEILPYRAQVIDGDSPAFDAPLKPEFGQAFAEFLASPLSDVDLTEADRAASRKVDPLSEWLVSNKQIAGVHRDPDAAAIGRAAARHNTKTLLEHIAAGNRLGVSLDGLLGKIVKIGDANIGRLDPMLVQRFLMSLGVDGIQQRIEPSVAPGKHPVVSYWRYDNIGDKDTWLIRSDQSRYFSRLGRALVNGPERRGGGFGEGLEGRGELLASRNLRQNDAHHIVDSINANVPLLSAEKTRELWDALHSPHIDPYKLMLGLADASPRLRKLLQADVGVREKYRLHEHTQAVLGQFERYFGAMLIKDKHGAELAAVIRMVLICQDGGKPLAQVDEARRSQSVYNRFIAKDLLGGLPTPPRTKNLMLDLVGQDFMGSAFRANQSRDDPQAIVDGANQLKALASKYTDAVSPTDIYAMARIINACDASAYTQQARYRHAPTGLMTHCQPGGPGWMFEYAGRTDRLRYSPAANSIYEQFRSILLS